MQQKLVNVPVLVTAGMLSAHIAAEAAAQHELAHGRTIPFAVVSDAQPLEGRETAGLRDDWPWWRGPAGDNRSLGPRPPLEWGTDKNVIWRTDVPGRGHGSPCIVGDRVFLPSADDAAGDQFLLCYDRNSGALVWRADLHHSTLPKIHDKNSHASATPACDGGVVYLPLVHSEELWLSAVTIDGQILWQKKIGGFVHATGYGASPVLFRNLVIVASDNREDPAIAALNAADGKLAWKTVRPKSDSSATPVIANIAGRTQLLMNGAFAVISYDPAIGEELWRVNHATEVAACTMAFDDECVYASGNYPEKTMMCVRADGTGDVTHTHVRWNTNNSTPYVPSPLVDSDLLYLVIDSGVAFCRNARSGDVIWKQRLAGSFYSSPIEVDEHILATNDAGVTYVFRASSSFNLSAENDIGEACMATPAICGGYIYLRTNCHLYCIGEKGEAQTGPNDVYKHK